MRRLFVSFSLLVSIAALATYGSGQRRADSDHNRTVHRVDYEPSVVELRGRLLVRRFYGPPNFGESPKRDLREAAWVISLVRPIDVRAKEDAVFNYSSVKNVREIQLMVMTNVRKLRGKTVVVSGTIFPAHSGYHHTDVLLQVKSIRLATPN